ncbi:MAG: helix-turn-helix transcriptional regulator [Pseudomonadota bacterium]
MTVEQKVPNPVDIQVGARVRMRRMLVGLSQEKLGEKIGLTFQQIQKYEKGTNRISASRMHQIADVLDVSVGYFFEGTSNGEDKNAEGFSEKSAPYMTDFLGTSDGLQLNKAFMRIKDQKVRRKIIDLVKSLADEGHDA